MIAGMLLIVYISFIWDIDDISHFQRVIYLLDRIYFWRYIGIITIEKVRIQFAISNAINIRCSLRDGLLIQSSQFCSQSQTEAWKILGLCIIKIVKKWHQISPEAAGGTMATSTKVWTFYLLEFISATTMTLLTSRQIFLAPSPIESQQLFIDEGHVVLSAL